VGVAAVGARRRRWGFGWRGGVAPELPQGDDAGASGALTAIWEGRRAAVRSAHVLACEWSKKLVGGILYRILSFCSLFARCLDGVLEIVQSCIWI
jgi:hypothetical protein